MSDLVECYAGYKYAERPKVLHWEGQRLEIDHIDARWLTPAGQHFRVHTKNHQNFEIIYSIQFDRWQVFVV